MNDDIAAVRSTLEALEIGPPEVHENLAIFPVFGAQAGANGYLALGDALATGELTITEISEGSVPDLRVRNALATSVLLLDGDELVGAKQNRVLNITVLVPGKADIKVPVSCVEQGRWRYASASFSAGETLYARGRAANTRSVSESVRHGRGARADQGEVWSSIAAKQGRMGVRSETGAANQLYEDYRARLDGFAGRFRPADGQRGAVFAIDGRIVGIDLFGSPATLSAQLPRLVRSYALDAMEGPPSVSAVPTDTAVASFRARLCEASMTSHPAVGLGSDVRLENGQLGGGALVVDGAVVHLCAFDLSDGEEPRRARQRQA